MRVTEVLTFNSYDADPRFQAKKPYRRGSRKQSCGDNIYYRDAANRQWLQRDSFHSNLDGSRRADHVQRDTGVNRVLASDERSAEHTSELQSLMRIPSAVFCLKKKIDA